MLRKALSLALYIVACLAVVLCLALLALCAVLLFNSVAVALHAAPVALAVTQRLPSWLAFWGVLPSPFGGLFRTDFFVLAIVLLIGAKVVRRIARLL